MEISPIKKADPIEGTRLISSKTDYYRATVCVVLNSANSTTTEVPGLIDTFLEKDTFLPSSEDKFKNGIFYWFVFFWSLYGVFAIMTYKIKNTGYNILDIFAKNLFGVFLSYIIWSKSKQEEKI